MKTNLIILFLAIPTFVIGYHLIPDRSDNQPETKVEVENSNPKIDSLMTSHYSGKTYHIGWDLDKEDEFTYNKPSEERFEYGYYISFEDSINYKIYYTAPCGNDCFTTRRGEYKLITPDTLEMVLYSIEYEGICRKDTEYYEEGIKTQYKVEHLNDSIRLKKIIEQ